MRGGTRGRAAVATAVAAAVAGLLAGCGERGTYEVYATFDDVGDLVTNHSVQVADVRVGNVAGIELTDDFRARVTLSIRNDVRIPVASTAHLRTTSLLGEKFVELRPDDQARPADGPFLADDDVVARTAEAPEVEFVAEEAIRVLGAVTGDDLATVIDTGAAGFGGRTTELRSLIDDLSSISATLASRTGQITRIIDSLDAATATLARGHDDVGELLVTLSRTTTVLAEHRQRAVTALAELSRLARAQNGVLTRYRGDIDRQIKQVDAVLAVVAGQAGEVSAIVDWLDGFVTNVPTVVPDDFTQVYMWLVPENQDPRTGGGR